MVCIQETRLHPKDKTPELGNVSSVLRERTVQGEARVGGHMIYIRKQIPYKISHLQTTNSSAMEKLTIEISKPNNQTFTVSNWYLPPENEHYLQRSGISLSELNLVSEPGTKVHEVISADVNAHDSAWDQTPNLKARGEYLVNAANGCELYISQ